MEGNQPAIPFSEQIPTRPPLATPGGAVSIAAAAAVAVSIANANRFGYLQHMEAICTVAGTTAGNWILRDMTAGATLLLLQQPVAVSVVGTRYCWAFPFPWKTQGQGDVFTVEPSAATLGTWVFFVNGFHSSL